MSSSDGICPEDSDNEFVNAFCILRKRGWFGELRPETQDSLQAVAKLRRLSAGQSVYRAGDIANGLFGLVTGNLHVTIPRDDGLDTGILRLEPGAWFGAPAILSRKPRNMSVTAVSNVELVCVSQTHVKNLLSADPRMYQDVLELIHASFSLTLRLLATSLTLDSYKRVALRLLVQYEQAGGPREGLASSQAEMADLCGVSVATFQRAIKKLAAEGIVKPGYSRIQITDRERLLRFCAD